MYWILNLGSVLMSRKHNRNTYIIIALICLIIFNIGTILININRERARPVIKMEKLHIKDTGIFVFLFGETSSIINIHRHQIKQGKNWDNSSYGILSIVNEIKGYLIINFLLYYPVERLQFHMGVQIVGLTIRDL